MHKCLRIEVVTTFLKEYPHKASNVHIATIVKQVFVGIWQELVQFFNDEGTCKT